MAAHLARLLLSAVLLTADAGNFSQNISFQDLHGKLNYLRLRNGSLQWCAEKRCHQPKSLQLDFNSSLEGDAAGCKYHVIGQLPDRTTSRPSATKLDLTAMPPHIGPGPLILRDGMMAQPATKPLVKSLIPTQVQLSANFLGPLQRDLVREMQMMAKQAGVPISGSALDELSAPAAGEVGTDEGLSFPVPLQPTGNIFIVLNWTNATEPCVAVVPHPEDCSTCSFGPDSCRANSRLEGPDKETLLSYQLPRQPFMLTDDLNARHEHSVCIREANGTVPSLRLLGRIAYYRKPQVSFIKNILIIGVRTFINPGWHEEIHLQCTNCSAASQVVVQPISYDSRCRSVTQQMLAALAVANRHEEMPASVDISELRNSQMEEAAQHGTTAGINCPVPSSGPCSGYADGAFAVGYRKSTDYDDTSHATFILDSSRRLTGHEKQIFFHHRSAICLYPGGPAAHGWLVGFAVVHMNVLDMQAFIGFVCFFGVALPLLCLVTALLHYNKYERCKHHVRQLRLEYQREQLERELATGEEEVETGTVSRQRSGNVPSSSSRDTGPVRPPEMNYQVLSGEPRASTSSAFLRPS